VIEQHSSQEGVVEGRSRKCLRVQHQLAAVYKDQPLKKKKCPPNARACREQGARQSCAG
jgi:hypothetical protein